MPEGRLAPLGRLTEASNATFLCRDEADALWVYKPVAGERPLWDFPTATLARREVAAHDLSERFGFGVVPLTLWLDDGPAGPGSVQQWITGEVTDLVDVLRPEELDETWLPVLQGEDEEGRPIVVAHRDEPALRSMCLFDLVINNSDRKAGHMISDGARLWGVDHGVSLHVQDKFRTVLWGFARDPFTEQEQLVLSDVASLPGERPEGLDEEEWEAVAVRAATLLGEGAFPEPSGDWPAIPWPIW